SLSPGSWDRRISGHGGAKLQSFLCAVQARDRLDIPRIPDQVSDRQGLLDPASVGGQGVSDRTARRISGSTVFHTGVQEDNWTDAVRISDEPVVVVRMGG